MVADLVADANAARPITAGGTGAVTAAAARTALDVPAKVASTTDNAIARFDGTSGQLQDSPGASLSDNSDLTLSYTDSGALAGPVIQLDRNSGSPAVNDLIGAISFRGKDNAGSTHAYANIIGVILDPVNGTEDGQLLLQASSGGSVNTVIAVQASLATVNGTLAATSSLASGTFSGTGATAGQSINGAGQYSTSVTVTSAFEQLRFFNPNGQVGSISTSGSATAFNTSSDERLKENFQDFDSGEIIDATRVYTFDWKSGGVAYGVRAQELHAVFPDAVFVGSETGPGEEGFSPWSVDYSKLVPVLLREVQALRARLKGAGL